MKIVDMDFSVTTKQRDQLVDITSRIRSAVEESGITDGDILVFCPHTTAAITINENADPNVLHDLLLIFRRLIPQEDTSYRHAEGNSDAHCKSSLVGCSETVMIKNRSLTLGTWQGVFFCEFDGPRNRRVKLQIRGE